MVRKSGFLLIIVIPVAAALALYVFRNEIVAGIAENALGQALDTEVSVEGVDLNPLAMTAEFGKLRIVDRDDPSQYMVVAGPGKFDLNGLQLFAGKVIVENFQVENLGVGIPRPPGEIPKEEPKRKSKKKRKEKSGGKQSAAQSGSEPTGQSEPAGKTEPAGKETRPPVEEVAEEEMEEEEDGFNLEFEAPELNLDVLRGDVDVDLLMGDKDFASLKAIDKAEADSNKRFDKLEAEYANGAFESRYGKVRADFKAVDFNSTDPRKLKNSLTALKKANGGAKALGGDIKNFSESAKSTYSAVRASIRNIDKKIDEDIASVKSLANLGDIDASKIGEILFGRSLLDQFNWVMAKVKLAKEMLGSDDDSADLEPKLRAGRIITYPVTGRAYPNFLIETTKFTGFTPDEAGRVGLKYSGKMTGLSSNARIYGKPLIVTASASRAGESSWAIDGTFDHRKSPGSDRLRIVGRNVDLGEFNMGGGDLMPEKAFPKNGRVNIGFGVTGDSLDGTLIVKAKKLNFLFEKKADKGDRLEKIIRDLFSGIKNADVTAKLSGTFSDPKFSVKSSIDEIFWKRTKQLFKQRVDIANKEIRKKVNAKVAARKAQLEKSLNARQKKIESKFDKVKNRARSPGAPIRIF